MKKLLLFISILLPFGINSFSQVDTTNNVSYDFLYMLFAHSETLFNSGYDPFQTGIGIRLQAPIAKLHYLWGDGVGSFYCSTGAPDDLDYTRALYTLGNSERTSVSYKIFDYYSNISDSCLANVTFDFPNQGSPAEQEKKFTYTSSEFTVYYTTAITVHPLQYVSVVPGYRFIKDKDPLIVNIHDKREDYLSHSGSNYTNSSKSCNTEDEHPFNYSEVLQVCVKGSTWHDLNVSLYDDEYTGLSINYSTISSAFNTEEFVGKECQIRLKQTFYEHTFVTEPVSFYYLPQLEVKNPVVTKPTCIDKADGSLSVNISPPDSSPEDSVEYLYLIYSYSTKKNTTIPDVKDEDKQFYYNNTWYYIYRADTSGNVTASQNGDINIGGLSAGMYKAKVYCLVKDKMYYPDSILIPISNPDPININQFTALNTNNYGYEVLIGHSNGPVQISVSGGSSPYYYSFKDTTQEKYFDPVILSPSSFSGPYDPSKENLTIHITDSHRCPSVSKTIPFKRAPDMSITGLDPDTLITKCNTNNRGPDSTVSVRIGITNGLSSIEMIIYGPDNFSKINKDLFLSPNGSVTLTGMGAGAYKVWVVDGPSGPESVQTDTFYVEDPPLLELDTIAFSGLNCSDDSAIATLTISNPDISNYHFFAEPSITGVTVDSSVNVLKPLVPGQSYDFYFKIDTVNCYSNIKHLTIPPAPEPLAVTKKITDVTCYIADNGSATLNITGGTLGSTGYALSGIKYPLDTLNDTTFIYSRLVTGNYKYIITDANKCSKADSFPIAIVPDTMHLATLTATPSLCDDLNNGKISVSIHAGEGPAPPYHYVLTRGKSDDIAEDTVPDLSKLFTELIPADYSVTVTDTNHCSSSKDTTIITDPDSLTWDLPAFAFTNTDCPGAYTGTATVGAKNGSQSAGYYFELQQAGKTIADTSAVTALFHNLTNGNYQLVVTDDSLCSISRKDIIIGSDSIPVHFNLLDRQDQYCNEAENGRFRLLAFSKPGNIIDSIFLTNPDNTFEFLSDNNEAEKGGLIADPRGYKVTAIDDKGCGNDTTISIINLKNNPKINLVDYDSLACNDATNGMFTFNSSQDIPQGILAYDLEGLKENAQVGRDIVYSDLSKGTYHLHVADTMGCSADSDFTLNVISYPLSISDLVIDTASCIRAANGSAGLTSSGSMSDNPGYYFVLNGKDTLEGRTVIFEDMPVGGPNQIYAYDKFGCSDNTPRFLIPVRSDSLLLFTDKTTDASCPEYATGNALLRAINGNPASGNFTYTTFNNNTSETIKQSQGPRIFLDDSLTKGNYYIEVTDKDNCLANTYFTINEPDTIEFSMTHNFIRRKGDHAGQISASISKGNGKYIYEWYKGITPSADSLITSDVTTVPIELSGLSAGTYMLRVQDTAGCPFWGGPWLAKNVIIPEPQYALTLQMTSKKQVSCNGLSDGQFTLEGYGGWGNDYSYGADTLNMSPKGIFSSLAKGNYSYYVKDTTGVINSASFEMTEPDSLKASVSEVTDANCHDSSDGKIQLDITGGNSDYSISTDQSDWMPGNVAEGLPANNYTLYVKDTLGCAFSLQTSVRQPDEIFVADTSIKDTRCKKNDGVITATIGGGTPGYRYHWKDSEGNDIPGNASADSLYSGVYYLTVTDAHACPADFNFPVSDITNLTIQDFSTTPVSCWQGTDGSAQVKVVKGFPPYSISWSDGTTGDHVDGLSSGNYLLSVIDNEGCKQFREFNIGTPDSISLQVDRLISPSCYGVDDGEIQVTASGGTPGYDYLWSNGKSRSKISGLDTGNYSVNILDANNCPDQRSFRLDYQQAITSDLPDEFTICSNNDYPLDAGNFAWFNWTKDGKYLSSDEVYNVNEAGLYKVDIEDAEGCKATDSVLIKMSETNLQAQFLMASVVTVGDTVVIFEASDPVPDSIRVLLPSSFDVVESGPYYRYITVKDTGTFDISLISYRNDCQDIITKPISVLAAGENNNSMGKSASGIIQTFSLKPNPTDGNFETVISLTIRADVLLRVVSFADGTTITRKKLTGESDYLTFFRLSGLAPGVYLLNLQTENEMRNIKFIIL